MLRYETLSAILVNRLSTNFGEVDVLPTFYQVLMIFAIFQNAAISGISDFYVDFYPIFRAFKSI